MILLFSNNVLRDCETALELLEEERRENVWRIHWVGAIALIRAVGHVLRHVDRREFPQLAPKIDAAFEDWRVNDRHRIFRDFIDQERNNILKEYRSSIHDLGVVRLTVQGGEGQAPSLWLNDQEGNSTAYFELDENMYRPRLDGYMAGEDARDIYKTGIEWWRSQLATIIG